MAAVCVYCSSSGRIDPRYVELAAAVGTELARRGHTPGQRRRQRVDDGRRCAGRAGRRRAHGRRHPAGAADLEVADHDADELVVTDDMRARKGVMDAPSRRVPHPARRPRHARGAARDLGRPDPRRCTASRSWCSTRTGSTSRCARRSTSGRAPASSARRAATRRLGQRRADGLRRDRGRLSAAPARPTAPPTGRRSPALVRGGPGDAPFGSGPAADMPTQRLPVHPGWRGHGSTRTGDRCRDAEGAASRPLPVPSRAPVSRRGAAGARVPRIGADRVARPAGSRPRRASGTPARRARPRPPWPPGSPGSRPSVGVERLADEVLVRQRHEHRPAGRDQLVQPPRELQRVVRRLPEVVGRVDEDPVAPYAGRHRPLRQSGHRGDHVGHHVVVRHAVRVGARRQAAGVAADQRRRRTRRRPPRAPGRRPTRCR